MNVCRRCCDLYLRVGSRPKRVYRDGGMHCREMKVSGGKNENERKARGVKKSVQARWSG